MDDDDINICSEIWNDIDTGNELDPIFCPCRIIFMSKFSAGFRFRYQSEIDKKSYSLLKSDINGIPVIQFSSIVDKYLLKIELVTADDRAHFNMFYEVTKDKIPSMVDNGICYIHCEGVGEFEIKLDTLGIRKMKSKEAMIKIKELYPDMKESEMKIFFNKNKDIVRLKATMFESNIPICWITSDPIKSQISKDNTNIKIKHLAPKVVAGFDEQLIIVLEKKITTSDYEACICVNEKSYPIKPVDEDGQTFVFNLPKVECFSPLTGTFKMACGDNHDSKPIKFLPATTEPRKRKPNPVFLSNHPLKRPNVTDNESFARLQPESKSGDKIETDSVSIPDPRNDHLFNDNDSGIHSSDRFSDKVLTDEDMDSISEESDDDSIEVEGFRRRKENQNGDTRVIHIPLKVRSAESHLDINVSNSATKKILCEVARIGHDFAFGKNAADMFNRIEKQLPVIFTLQDDVGDTPLNNAILKGNYTEASKILEIIKRDCQWALDLVNTSGHSALILAPACDAPQEFMEELLSAGCNLELWDDTGKSALIYAIEYQNEVAMKVLLNHVKKLNLTSLLRRYKTSYYSPLQIALMSRFKQGVELLLELRDCNGDYMVDVNEVGLTNDETALHIAVSHDCDVDIIQLLLNRSDINVNQTLSNKTTALHVAQKMKLFEIVKLLKSYNAVDLSSVSEIDNIDDSEDELEHPTDESDMMVCEVDNAIPEKMPMAEMSVGQASDVTINGGLNGLTDAMRQLSLKGEMKTKLIEILLLSSGPTLTISNLRDIVPPGMSALFKKYGNTDENKRDISELLVRFNCLPSSLGQLVQLLEEIERFDLVDKIKMNLNT